MVLKCFYVLQQLRQSWYHHGSSLSAPRTIRGYVYRVSLAKDTVTRIWNSECEGQKGITQVTTEQLAVSPHLTDWLLSRSPARRLGGRVPAVRHPEGATLDLLFRSFVDMELVQGFEEFLEDDDQGDHRKNHRQQRYRD